MPCGDANCRLRESELLTSGPPQIARPYEFPSSVVPLFAVLGTSTNLFSLLTSNKSAAFAAFLADEVNLVIRKVSDEKLPDIRMTVKAINTRSVNSPKSATIGHDLVVSNPNGANSVDFVEVNSATAAKCPRSAFPVAQAWPQIEGQPPILIAQVWPQNERRLPFSIARSHVHLSSPRKAA
jgi:hypothetical protein